VFSQQCCLTLLLTNYSDRNFYEYCQELEELFLQAACGTFVHQIRVFLILTGEKNALLCCDFQKCTYSINKNLL
jgi:hypothetical protein